MHKLQFIKGGIRKKYSTGSICSPKKIRKGTMCEYGQITGASGVLREIIGYQDFEKRRAKILNKISWLSHKFKSEEIIGG